MSINSHSCPRMVCPEPKGSMDILSVGEADGLSFREWPAKAGAYLMTRAPLQHFMNTQGFFVLALREERMWRLAFAGCRQGKKLNVEDMGIFYNNTSYGECQDLLKRD